MSALAAALLLAGWSAGLLLGWRLRTLDLTRPGAPGTVAISVVVPARDEARTLPRLLASLAAQTLPPTEVIVVDDGSTDDTAAVAAAAGTSVLRAPEPPVGWLGKPWACHLGVAAARGEVLVLLDADTWLAPDGLARLVATHEQAAPDGLLSVQPRHHVERPYEQLSLVCSTVPVLASGMGRPGSGDRHGLAFGPCLVTSTVALGAVGGFAAVRGEVLEDAALAQAFHAAGRPVALRAGGPTVSFRMHPGGVGQMVEGWTKHLAGGAARAPRLAALGAVAWVAALAVAATALRQPSLATVVAWAVTAAQVAWLGRRVGTFRPWTWLLFPVPLVAFIALFTRSGYLRLVRRQVRWRGRAVPVGG